MIEVTKYRTMNTSNGLKARSPFLFSVMLSIAYLMLSIEVHVPLLNDSVSLTRANSRLLNASCLGSLLSMVMVL